MENADLERMVNTWANDPYITCEDVTKCGQCWQEKIQSEVAKEFLTKGIKIDSAALCLISRETKLRWRKTDLYVRVKKMLAEGKDLKEIEKELRKEGIEI